MNKEKGCGWILFNSIIALAAGAGFLSLFNEIVNNKEPVVQYRAGDSCCVSPMIGSTGNPVGCNKYGHLVAKDNNFTCE